MFPLECDRTGAILLRSDWCRPCLSGRTGRRCEGIRLASLPVRQPNAAAQENGTGATRQSRWLRTADGFAVLSSTATKTPLEAYAFFVGSGARLACTPVRLPQTLPPQKHSYGGRQSRQFQDGLAASLFVRHEKIGPPFQRPKESAYTHRCQGRRRRRETKALILGERCDGRHI